MIRRRCTRQRHGGILVLMVIALIPMIGFVALAVDLGMLT